MITVEFTHNAEFIAEVYSEAEVWMGNHCSRPPTVEDVRSQLENPNLVAVDADHRAVLVAVKGTPACDDENDAEVHMAFPKSMRGKDALEASMKAAQLVFESGFAKRLIGVPPTRLNRWFALRCGLRRIGQSERFELCRGT